MIKNYKKHALDFICVLLFAAAAIVLHAIMPSPGAAMDTSVFDSMLVKKFGFPAVASGYFVILFVHILITIKVFAVKSDIGKWKTGCCFGMAFSLLYMGGMQEIMVSASPLTEYGLDFVLYELFLGLGDAVPVVIWTVIFGFIIGLSYCLINYSLEDRGRKVVRLFLTIGVNWIWFNCYIGLIAAHAFGFMVLRAGTDVLAILIGAALAERTIEKRNEEVERNKKYSE